ncbi:MAG: hypothetical protein LBD09_03005 [Treponema sp.]|jgi:hypothetical protein|nr:hypothetical protein [Treponema sp.]
MSQKTDLYNVLFSYAKKNDSPLVQMEGFISFLEQYAKRIREEKPEWGRWAEDTGARVWLDMNRLTEEGKVTVLADDTGSGIRLCHYYAEQVRAAWRNGDEQADRPFPGEASLALDIPPEEIKTLDLGVDLCDFIEEGRKDILPIIKLAFPGGRSGALLLASMIPGTLLEFAFLKVRNYLGRHGNREYVQHKLGPQLTGKEEQLREIMNQIMNRPRDCLRDLENGREVSFYFWASFSYLLRSDLAQKDELLPEEEGALQAASVIETCGGYFKKRAVKAREIELAFRNFELELDRPPYWFSREAIARFRDNKGVPLLGQYTQEGLDAYIKKRSTEPAAPNELPELLFFHNAAGAAWLVKKTKVLPLCARLFAETRPLVIKAFSRRWKKLLKQFRREPAMDNDRDFERLIVSYVSEYAPVLKALLEDRKLYLVHEEARLSGRGIPESSRLFDGGEILPLRILLLLKRRQILGDIKLLMPFWYTLPIISGIVAFFAKMGKKKKTWEEPEDGQAGERDPLQELRGTAREAEKELVPRGQTLDGYLEELASRWRKLLNKQAWDNLVEDINSLIRDRLRHILRIQKHIAVTQDALDKLTAAIIESSQGLKKIGEQKALFLYIKVYLIKLFLHRKNL